MSVPRLPQAPAASGWIVRAWARNYATGATSRCGAHDYPDGLRPLGVARASSSTTISTEAVLAKEVPVLA